MALSLAKPELLIPHVDRLIYWLQQDEWWLSTASMFALTKLTADERTSKKVMPAISELLSKNTRIGACVGRSWPVDGIVKQLQSAKPEVKKLSSDALAKAYADFVPPQPVSGGVDLKPVSDYNLDRIAGELIQLPGGYETLYKISRKRFPAETLPHAACYAKANLATLSPELKAAIEASKKADADAAANKKAAESPKSKALAPAPAAKKK
jgi:hypothetical protein